MLIAGLSALFVSLGAFVGGTGGLILFLLIAVLFNFAMYWFSAKIALKTHALLDCDVTAERFTNHDGANELLQTKYRSPYELPKIG